MASKKYISATQFTEKKVRPISKKKVSVAKVTLKREVQPGCIEKNKRKLSAMQIALRKKTHTHCNSKCTEKASAAQVELKIVDAVATKVAL